MGAGISGGQSTPGLRELPGPDAPGLLTRRFVGILALAFSGFALEIILRPTVPLIILDRGGNAVVVGLIAAIYSAPSMIFRPVIGSLLDRWDLAKLLRIGAVPGMIMPLGLLLPGLAPLAVVRLVHGTGWSIFSVCTQTLVARFSPPERRGEAAGYFHAMPALATLVGPGIAVGLYIAFGEIGPVLLAVALGSIAFLLALRLRIPRPTEAASGTRQASPVAATGAGRAAGRMARLRAAGLTEIVERSALPATLMVTTFMSSSALFIVFAPVYAVAVGAPVASLAAFYPVYGLVLSTSHTVAGRVSDRTGRERSIRLGTALASTGLVVAAMGDGMVTFTIGAAAFAMASSLVTPTLSAMTADRAPAGRLGAAIATYTAGYQMATGVSSILWGSLIAAFGFPWPFIVAIVLQGLTAVTTFRLATGRG